MTGAAEERDAPLTADERAALVAAHERRVDALRHSAQYRVGELVIAGVRSPRRLVRLPLDLWRLRKELVATYQVTPLTRATQRAARQIPVLTILDEVSQQAFAPEWDQRPLTDAATPHDLAAIGPALLFVEPVPFTPSIRNAVETARAAGIPTVFWNNQDPVHFDAFADAATSFDWIFTTDADCVDRYIRLTGNDRVEALPFAAQPRLHNPIGASEPRLPRACFAGSWQTDGFVGWTAEIELLVRPALDAGRLDIFDRMAAPGATGTRFPAPYDRAVVGVRTYLDLAAEYRRYSCSLNVSSVKTSPTMCPRRIFESLACRTPVVSTPSRAIEELLGDAVITVETRASARSAVERLITDPDHRDRLGHIGYRAVMAQHTYGHRVDHLLGILGIRNTVPKPNVTVLAPTNRPEYLDHLLRNFTRQRDVSANLILLTNSARFDPSEVDRRLASIEGARAIHLAEGMTMGECLNAGLSATDARFIAKFDDDDHYGAHYLHDALLVHRFVDAAIVGKKTFFAYLEGADETILRSPGNEFTAANRVSGSTILVDRTMFPDARFAALNLGEDIDLCEQAMERGLVVFSADRFNYVAVRRRDTSTHSWTISQADYGAGAVRVAAGLSLDRTMV